jgi:hypothetical protein
MTNLGFPINISIIDYKFIKHILDIEHKSWLFEKIENHYSGNEDKSIFYPYHTTYRYVTVNSILIILDCLLIVKFVIYLESLSKLKEKRVLSIIQREKKAKVKVNKTI